MNVWKVVLATLVIFIAGIVTGVILVRIAQGPHVPRPWQMQRGPGDNSRVPSQPMNPPGSNFPNDPRSPGTQPPGLLSREFIQILERQLQLTPEQRERIGRIMVEGQERVRELRSRIDPDLRKELQQTKEQIRAVLTPEQREQFEQMMKRSPRRGERSEPGQRLREGREPRNPPPADAPPGGEPRNPSPVQPQDL